MVRLSAAQTILNEWWGRMQSPAADSAPSRMSVRNRTRDTLIGDSIELADKGARRRKGLLGRTALHRGEGLWIVPCESVHTFFMKFALDLVYLDRNRTVVKVRCGVAPWRVSASLRAHSILELPAGTIRTTGTQRGDLMEIVPIHSTGAVASCSHTSGQIGTRILGVAGDPIEINSRDWFDFDRTNISPVPRSNDSLPPLVSFTRLPFDLSKCHDSQGF